MSRRAEQYLRNPAPANNNAAVRATASRRQVARGKRARVAGTVVRGPYMPPEKWYEPSEKRRGAFDVIVQAPGAGYRHIVTEDEVRQRLAQLPAWMVEPLEVVQLSQMTHKKRRVPCYGMQWGNTIYLYPIEDNLIETFCEPPKPAQQIEAAMFGGRWEHATRRTWNLVWTEETIRDFYLNNVLIHELGHILDDRNTSYVDRERYAEWFATEYGYRGTGGAATRRPNQKVIKRHHN